MSRSPVGEIQSFKAGGWRRRGRADHRRIDGGRRTALRNRWRAREGNRREIGFFEFRALKLMWPYLGQGPQVAAERLSASQPVFTGMMQGGGARSGGKVQIGADRNLWLRVLILCI